MFIDLLPDAPDLLALHATDRTRFPFLLMSSGTKGHDILFALPREMQVYGEGEMSAMLDRLASLPLEAQTGASPGVPFIGGWFVYLGYEMLAGFEPAVPAPLPDAFPLGAIARVPAAIVLDRATGVALSVAEDAESRAALAAALAGASGWTPSPFAAGHIAEDAPGRYVEAVGRIKDYIREGDVFQVNISRGWEVRLPASVSSADIFAALRTRNPAPFSALADFGSSQIISASPERLVEVRDGRVVTRPIAGTHPRSPDPAEDAALRARLISSSKERAEHIMLIDLERNDLGRVCQPGTVRVDELMAVESYAFVHHIESTVSGRLAAGMRPLDVIRALFPGGTITGCPKVRTMQIIRELEDRPRRAYTGSLGYINRDGSLDLNILIRTLMRQGDVLRFRAGGGIVADSDPERELQETRHKARGLLRGLGVEDA